MEVITRRPEVQVPERSRNRSNSQTITVTSIGTSVVKFFQPGAGSVSYVFYSLFMAAFCRSNLLRLFVADEFAHHLVAELGHESLLYKMVHVWSTHTQPTPRVALS